MQSCTPAGNRVIGSPDLTARPAIYPGSRVLSCRFPLKLRDRAGEQGNGGILGFVGVAGLAHVIAVPVVEPELGTVHKPFGLE